VNKSEFSLTSILEEIVTLYKTSIKEKGLELQTDLAPGLNITTDCVKLRHIINNLVVNAI